MPQARRGARSSEARRKRQKTRDDTFLGELSRASPSERAFDALPARRRAGRAGRARCGSAATVPAGRPSGPQSIALLANRIAATL